MSQENSHSSFCNCLEIVDVDERGGYRYHIRHYPYHNTAFLVVSLVFSVHCDKRGGCRSYTINLNSHNHGGQYRAHPRLPHNAFHRGVR